MSITFQHPEYRDNAELWEMVEDVCDGQHEVKSKDSRYLPIPNPKDLSTENLARYEQYKARAVFYNVTRRTLTSLTGAAFRKAPSLTVPPIIGYVDDDIDGAGLSIYQQSQEVLADALKYGRGCLLVDYPRTETPASVADMQSGAIRATVVRYEAEDVINWRMEQVGAQFRLSLVVISECETVQVDDFETAEVDQYRALRLIDGIYTVEIYRQNEKREWYLFDSYVPRTGNGGTWSEIPFTFVGSVANSASVDPSPLYDMAVLNLAHYRNSADYEDSVFFSGQPQPWMAGLTEEWRDWLQEQGIRIGSRVILPLPEGGQFGFAQAAPNPLAKEAMDAKERQMQAIGARLITPGSAVKTATEAQGDQEAEHSVLSLVAANVSEAYTQCLNWMLAYMNASGDVSYEIHVDPGKFQVDGVMLGALVAANQAGKLPDADLYRIMRRLDVIDPSKTDEQITEELAASVTSGNVAGFGMQ